MRALGVGPARAVLAGDSLSDITGAHAAGVRSIGYANRPAKAEVFQPADVVIESMGALAQALVEIADGRS